MLTTQQVSNEVPREEIIKGDIPSIVYEVSHVQNIDAGDIWGVYLSPDDPRNPSPGENYIGLKNVSIDEFKKDLAKRENDLKSGNEIVHKYLEFLEVLSNLPNEDLKRIIDEGLQAIETHELAHKNQYTTNAYQTRVLELFNKVNLEADPTKKETIREQYQDLVLLAEVQALAAQCSKDTLNTDELKAFNVYWFAKVFKLMSGTIRMKSIPKISNFDTKTHKLKIDYVDEDVDYLKSLHLSLQNGLDYNSNIPDVNGLLSRAFFLCDNPTESLKQIREGDLDYNTWREMIYKGLDWMYQASPKDISVRGKKVFESLFKPIKDLSQEEQK